MIAATSSYMRPDQHYSFSENGHDNKKIWPRSWDGPLDTLVTSVLGEKPQGKPFKINILILFDV